LNLHSLSAGGFQDRKVGLDLIRPPRIYQHKSGCAAIKVIEVTLGSFPLARNLSAKREKPEHQHLEGIQPQDPEGTRIYILSLIKSLDF